MAQSFAVKRWSKALDLWAYQNKVKLDFIEPGKPTQNGQIESFNGRFRAECLDQEWFGSLQQARKMIEALRRGGSATIAKGRIPVWAICRRMYGRKTTISNSRI